MEKVEKKLKATLRNYILQGQVRDTVNVGNIISKYELKAYNLLKHEYFTVS